MSVAAAREAAARVVAAPAGPGLRLTC